MRQFRLSDLVVVGIFAFAMGFVLGPMVMETMYPRTPPVRPPLHFQAFQAEPITDIVECAGDQVPTAQSDGKFIYCQPKDIGTNGTITLGIAPSGTYNFNLPVTTTSDGGSGGTGEVITADPSRAVLLSATFPGNTLYVAKVPKGAETIEIRITGVQAVGSVHVRGIESGGIDDGLADPILVNGHWECVKIDENGDIRDMGKFCRDVPLGYSKP